MRVVSAAEQARCERASGASFEELMERAGRGVAEFVEERVLRTELDWYATLLCGKGNNGGDAYVAGRYLLEMGYTVRAIQVGETRCPERQKEFLDAGGELGSTFHEKGVIIDGLFGTGFTGEVKGEAAELIRAANQKKMLRFAIDIPSGVNGNSGEARVAFTADWTIYLELPKTGFFIGDGWNYVGKLHRVELGLDLSDAVADFELIEREEAASWLPPIVRTRHKYQAGYVVGLAGSKEMPGAAILASEAALRAGAGMMRLLHPTNIEPHALGLPPEILVQPYESANDVLQACEKANAVFVGPGLGRSDEARKLVNEVLSRLDKPCVIDADALALLGEKLPEKAVLTPHHGEMAKLLGEEFSLERARQYAKGVTLVLKGGPTFVFGRRDWVVPKGDPGMATAGCGDVLTGVIASLLAQGLEPEEAACLGVYLHGDAGEQAAFELTSRALVASDVIHYLPEAFQNLASMRA